MDLTHRPRRLRSSAILRDMTAETHLDTHKLIMGYFVCEGQNMRQAIDAMPGIDRVSIDNLVKDVSADIKYGLKSALLFGIPDRKDERGKGAYAENGIVQQAVGALKKEFPELLLITDVCLCEYTSHGHCGLVENNKILNDPTLELLAETALSQAAAGADMVAPSDMMDGRVGVIRQTLDEQGFQDIPIMSYTAKYASAFYGPFREAADSAPQFGNRRSYQIDNRNALEAEKEAMLDQEEGADIIMVKPALSYLDIIYRVKQRVQIPVCAYNVSGEYSMVKTAAHSGFINEEQIVKEILTSIFRAGADMIISYHTRDILKNKWF